MDDHDITEEEQDESYKILYLTFLLIAVFFFFFVIMNIYDDPLPGLEAMNDDNNS